MVPGTKPKTRRAPLAGARVLIVDDHVITAGLIKHVVYAGGATTVHAVHNGEEAIATLKTFRPNLLVTDWQMPGMDGLTLTRIIRGAVFRPDDRIDNPKLPIVLISAHASVRAVEQARLAGVDEVVVKPFSTASLLKRLSAAAAKPRAFVVAEAYVGPDRRRKLGPIRGRRQGDPSLLSLSELAGR